MSFDDNFEMPDGTVYRVKKLINLSFDFHSNNRKDHDLRSIRLSSESLECIFCLINIVTSQLVNFFDIAEPDMVEHFYDVLEKAKDGIDEMKKRMDMR